MYEFEDLVKQLRACACAASCEACPYGYGGCEEDLMKNAADAIEELRKAVLRLEDESGIYDELPTFYIYPTKWIPVTEHLPNENGEYFVSGKGKVWVCEFMILGDVGGWCNSAKNPCVKYWMPRPEPPEDGEE